MHSSYLFDISQSLISQSFCLIAPIQTCVSFATKIKIKCFVSEFHDNFRFCGIANTNIEQIFNYLMRNRNTKSHFFTLT